MELDKLTMEEIRALSQERLQETIDFAYRKLADIRLDVYTEKGKALKDVRVAKRTIARIKTLLTEQKTTQLEQA